MAGGFVIKKEKIQLFRELLIKNYEKMNIDSSQNLNIYLDSVIAPSALNEKFYEEISCLGPFGSGNSEPKFVIENLQVITSNMIVDRHIRSILRGKDGSVIKSVAFNAKDSSLEPFLHKKNNCYCKYATD